MKKYILIAFILLNTLNSKNVFAVDISVKHGKYNDYYHIKYTLNKNNFVIPEGNKPQYGEVATTGMAPRVKMCSKIKKGQVIASIGTLALTRPRSMLHIEMFKGTETGRLTPKKPRDKFNKFCRRADIFDPTSIIDNAERD